MNRNQAALFTVTAVAATVVAVRWWLRRKERRLKQSERILRKFARECATPAAKLWDVADALVADMNASLSGDKSPASSLDMIVSFAAPLPSGEEKGLYYGINLRGKDFMMLRARLRGKDEPISDVQKQEISIPDDVLHSSSSEELCDFISMELVKFVGMNPPDDDEDEDEEEKKLGFTLSHSVEQEDSASCSVIQRKSLAFDQVEKEFVKEMNEALKKRGLKMQIHALADNVVGDLAGGRYYSSDTVAAITLGMGTNAAYVQQAREITRWNCSVPESGEIVISTEWGDFSSTHLPLTEFDASLDAESLNPGRRRFEKMVSGGYLGEVVRRVLLRMAEESALFGELVPSKLRVPYVLRSPDMAAMHQDTSEDRDTVNEKLKDVFGIDDSTREAREVVIEVCDVVAERAARLAGAGLVGIIKKAGRLETMMSTVTVEGGLYGHYRVFRNYLHSGVWEMLGRELSDHVVVEHSHGGSGAGAIFFAACGGGGGQDSES
ncbi:PREDICTED: probable hexokinase-like 2 protein [Tarenaya hassleriana]|uniref:probable hexokinase-like 2 protein n=1 Tax=Tarenaya hassleriana TaxID=28532 RepID=UPI00053C4401|nr:PREDICTED: probable hexokinase-like 2 protein [Tarenaya hassleriana]